MKSNYGRVTIPTDLDVVNETMDIVNLLEADALRDCDGTDFPDALKEVDIKIYSTYYTTRKDNEWANANPEEVQQMYLMTGFHMASNAALRIKLMDGFYQGMLKVNLIHDITRWWEVIDRTNGEVVPHVSKLTGDKAEYRAGDGVELGFVSGLDVGVELGVEVGVEVGVKVGIEVGGEVGGEVGVETVLPINNMQYAACWDFDISSSEVIIENPKEFHEYTVSFLAFIIWDPVHMYNYVTNSWDGVEPQLTFDVRQPKTHEFSLKRLRNYIKENPHVDVIRFTTFFHQFTLIFNERATEKYVDWYGYSASVSPYILEQFEKEVGYKFRPEYIIDQGYFNNTYRVPSKEYNDFLKFQIREVAKLAKEFVDIAHEGGKEAMMFLGDHWIGMEPFMPEFASVGLDAVVGSVGNGATLRLISDIPNVKYTEGRLLPYFFPDTFYKGSDPVKEAKINWVTSRRAILRKPIDRIGYGGYLKLALDFPEFIAYIKSVCDEFRTLYDNIKGASPLCLCRVAVLNSWGAMRAWGNHMVAHAKYYPQNYSYAGVIESLSGAPFDVKFINFEDMKENPNVFDNIDVIVNSGDAYTAFSGGEIWAEEQILIAIRRFIYNGGGFIGIGEPSACQSGGRFFQLATALGVDMEIGFGLSTNKYNWKEHPHFITEDCTKPIDFGEGKKNIYALDGTTVICQRDKNVQLAANKFGKGRSVYISGLPYSFENSRLLYRSIIWASHKEKDLNKWFSTNFNVEVHAYIENNKYCIVNNTYEPQKTTIYTSEGASFEETLCANEIKWYEIDKC